MTEKNYSFVDFLPCSMFIVMGVHFQWVRDLIPLLKVNNINFLGIWSLFLTPVKKLL